MVDTLFFSDADAFSEWLELHHHQTPEVWCCSIRRAPGRPVKHGLKLSMWHCASGGLMDSEKVSTVEATRCASHPVNEIACGVPST